jgi:hypothetical protein
LGFIVPSQARKNVAQDENVGDELQNGGGQECPPYAGFVVPFPPVNVETERLLQKQIPWRKCAAFGMTMILVIGSFASDSIREEQTAEAAVCT